MRDRADLAHVERVLAGLALDTSCYLRAQRGRPVAQRRPIPWEGAGGKPEPENHVARGWGGVPDSSGRLEQVKTGLPLVPFSLVVRTANLRCFVR
jgi:hypothetical protein